MVRPPPQLFSSRVGGEVVGDAMSSVTLFAATSCFKGVDQGIQATEKLLLDPFRKTKSNNVNVSTSTAK